MTKTILRLAICVFGLAVLGCDGSVDFRNDRADTKKPNSGQNATDLPRDSGTTTADGSSSSSGKTHKPAKPPTVVNGAAYLYCSLPMATGEAKPEEIDVGCRVEDRLTKNVLELSGRHAEWKVLAAEGKSYAQLRTLSPKRFYPFVFAVQKLDVQTLTVQVTYDADHGRATLSLDLKEKFQQKNPLFPARLGDNTLVFGYDTFFHIGDDNFSMSTACPTPLRQKELLASTLALKFKVTEVAQKLEIKVRTVCGLDRPMTFMDVSLGTLLKLSTRLEIIEDVIGSQNSPYVYELKDVQPGEYTIKFYGERKNGDLDDYLVGDIEISVSNGEINPVAQ